MGALAENFEHRLTQTELGQLAHYEGIIDRNLRGFREAGEAMAEIRDRDLYRDRYPTFEAYLEDRWHISRRHGYRLIEAAAIAADVTHGSQLPAPTSERQARALSVVPPAERADVWREAVERNGGEPASSTLIDAVVAERQAAEDARAREVLATVGPSAAKRRAEAQAAEPVEEPALEPEPPAKAKTDDEWFTPLKYIEAARAVMGGIDLDPASCERANALVEAAEYFGLDNGRNGLAEVWCAPRVFHNPPYSNAGAWVDKLVSSHLEGLVGEAILLVNANTSSAWFDGLWEFGGALCFVRGRISFVAGAREESKTGWSPSVFVYFGPRPEAFAREFEKFGRIVRPWDPEEVA